MPMRKGKKKRGNSEPTDTPLEKIHVHHASTSVEKLQNTPDDNAVISSDFGYCILNFIAVFSTIASHIICKT